MGRIEPASVNALDSSASNGGHRALDDGHRVAAVDGAHRVAAVDGAISRNPMLELSNAIVRLYKDAFGRGPTKARAQFAGPDTLIVVLENSMTVAERNMVAMGEHERLREARLFFSQALEAELRGIVEQTLARRPVAFISGMDTRHDVAIEVFTFEPVETVAQSAASRNGH